MAEIKLTKENQEETTHAWEDLYHDEDKIRVIESYSDDHDETMRVPADLLLDKDELNVVQAVSGIGLQEAITGSTPPAEENIYTPDGFPKLYYWRPEEDDLFFVQGDTTIMARYDKMGFPENLCTYHIVLKHFIKRMPDVLAHMNYFVKFYDTDKEFVMAYLSLKYIIDTKTDVLETKSLKNYILERIMTDSFMDHIEKMVNDLYAINIDTDKNNSYKSTPKITNEQAKVILAVSFTLRLILPACIHYTNVTPTITTKTGYIPCFISIFMDVIKKFEARSIPIYGALCNFVEYRIIKRSGSDRIMLDKKKQIHGENIETYLDKLIKEVIIVKAIYKLDYEQSPVSFFDGIIHRNYRQFKNEKFNSKPVELSSEDIARDNDDFLSHSEAIEMSMYRNNESNPIITKANAEKVMANIRQNFNIPISEEEFEFYMENVKLNPLIQKLLHMFYSRFFHDTTAINLIPRRDVIYLTIILKKFLQFKGMVLIPQLCTATVRGKFKENLIKNRRFNEKYENSTQFQHVLKEKFKYVEQLNPKESPIRKLLSTIINSAFIWVDTNPDINGRENADVDIDTMIDEFETFLLII